MSQVIVLTEDQLQKYFDDMVQKVEFIIKNSQKIEVATKEWLTAKEVCTLLKISLTTLHDWSSKSIIKKHRIGGRITFRHDEIIESIQRMEAKRKHI
ncbi:MAG: helix-turn-helix domain-containing protein [Saprospiraceae bacterium]|nr:helix-turn-helix domain-containing protein [Candidatus Defluviibacterium haderslevense]